MKLLSLQLAIFSKDIITRPDLIYNDINKKLGGVIDNIPTIVNLPQEIPYEFPIVQAKSNDGQLNINISRSRVDLIINFNFNNEQTPSSALASQKSLLNKFYRAVLDNLTANRSGFVVTMFSPQSSNINKIFTKYFTEKYSVDFVEASIRTNKQNIKKSICYNNIRLIEATTLNFETNKTTGILFQYDINNVLEKEKTISGDVISYIIYRGSEYVSDKAIREMI